MFDESKEKLETIRNILREMFDINIIPVDKFVIPIK